MSRRGRKAALPGTGGATARGLLGDSRVVRCFVKDGSEYVDFDFDRLPVSPQMQRGLVVAFARLTAPGSRLTSIKSFQHLFRAINVFAEYLATLPDPPGSLADLMPEDIDGFVRNRRTAVKDVSNDLYLLKGLLRRGDGVSDAMVVKLRERSPSRIRGDGKTSYSRGEFKRIAAAARTELRAAAERIRRNRGMLQQYRAGDLTDTARRLELLEYVDRYADVPRNQPASGKTVGAPRNWVLRHGSTAEIVGQLHLTASEAMAGAILLAVMTGQNGSVIVDIKVAHHRADGHTGRPATAILDTRKPRRGRHAYMNLALSEVPDWISIPDRPDQLLSRDELHTPFGVYALMLELTARSRELIGTTKLFVGYHRTGGGRGSTRGLRPADPDSWYGPWSRSHNLMSDRKDGNGNHLPLHVRMDLIQLTYLELHQKPVAHREKTLADDYLSRNRGSLADYQKVVAKALVEEVDKARARMVIAHLTPADLAQARSDPDAVAAEHGIDTTTLNRLIAGELDTVMAACVEDGASPNAAAGETCRASFMQCLSCPCARALPHHLPIQVLVHDRLETRKTEMTSLTWIQRFGLPHAQLADLLSRHDAVDVTDARAAATDADRALVERFLNRELDLR